MWKKNLIFLLIAVAVITVLLMAPDKEISYYPADEIHINAAKATNKKKMHEECGKCHLDGGENTLPDDHVKRERCYGCHTQQPAEEAE
jgi:hypothetical protein